MLTLLEKLINISSISGDEKNIGKIGGGCGMNVFAPYAEAEGIFRVTTSLSDLHEKMCAQQDQDIIIDILSECEPQRLYELPDFETTTVSFGTDAAYLRPLGDILLLGPGSIRHAHSDHEQITIQELHQAVNYYVRMVNELLKRKKT